MSKSRLVYEKLAAVNLAASGKKLISKAKDLAISAKNKTTDFVKNTEGKKIDKAINTAKSLNSSEARMLKLDKLKVKNKVKRGLTYTAAGGATLAGGAAILNKDEE